MINTKNLQANAMRVLYGTGGAIGGKFVRNKIAPSIPFIKDKPDLVALAPVLVGLFLMDNKNKMISDAGYGMAISSAADLATKKIPAIGEITGDDLDALADEVLEGLDDEINDVLNLNDDLSDDIDDDLSDDNDESVNDHVLEEDLGDGDDDGMNDENDFMG